MNRKYLIPVLFFIAVLVLVSLVAATTIKNNGQKIAIESEQKHNQGQEIPVKLKIPKLDIDANIESVGLNKQRAMEVPKEPFNVGWYNMGYRPGEAGNAVISGHLDDINGEPAIFYKLNTLEIGDTIIVIDAKEREKTFKVTKIKTYMYKDFPIEEVFGEYNTPRLNLITCFGKWDKEQNTYLERVVVFSELVL